MQAIWCSNKKISLGGKGRKIPENGIKKNYQFMKMA
jgi:hypothetical protein